MLLLWQAFESWRFKGLGSYALHHLLVLNHTQYSNSYNVLQIFFLNLYNFLHQGIFLHRRGMLVGGFSEECISHKVQDCFQRQSSWLPDIEEGSFWCRSSFHILHCYSFWVILYLLRQSQRQLPAIRRRNWRGYGNLQINKDV